MLTPTATCLKLIQPLVFDRFFVLRNVAGNIRSRSYNKEFGIQSKCIPIVINGVAGNEIILSSKQAVHK